VVVGTPTAIFLESLSETTKDEVIQTAITWTSADQETLTKNEELARTSDVTQATQEIARLEKIKKRITDATNMAAGLDFACMTLTNQEFEKVLAELNAAQRAHAGAVAERKTPEPLPGVASTNQWEILYRAAKQYSEEIAYPGETFPRTADAVCVLCQQPLDDEAVARFYRFKKFMEDATSEVLAAKRTALKSLREKVEALAPLSGAALEAIYDELASLDIKAADALRTFHIAVASRKAAAIALLKEGETPEKVSLLTVWPASIVILLQSVAQMLSQRITEITNASKPEEYQRLIAKISELKSRKALSGRKPDIDTFVTKARRNAILRRAVATLRTYEITKQGTNVIRKNLTPELVKAFKTELDTLGAIRMPISVKPCGVTGETAHEMLLEGVTAPGKTRMSQVLSEGEARAIAIAGFLAELKLAPHSNAIVLDDPVSSLDHVFTRKIAARLVREGLTRQVVIFTHNIAFLMEREDACMELAQAGTPIALSVHTLHRNAKSSGITVDGVPWHAMRVNQRVHYLDQLVNNIKVLYDDKIADYNERAAYIYGLLREAWESCVEDDLFYNVVCRYRNSVQTLKLIHVAIEDTDIHYINLNMSKASTWMTGHDKSKALDDNRPTPDELVNDINSLRVFSKKLIDRRNVTEKRRKKLLET
jgi:energy-coupling factor transporter ATP-binding protein EcfA2